MLLYPSSNTLESWPGTCLCSTVKLTLFSGCSENVGVGELALLIIYQKVVWAGKRCPSHL